MRPILLKGHERPLTQVKYNKEGDLLFTTAKDQVVNVYYSHNGERLGTFNGHMGALWSVDIDPTSTIVATGAADDTVKLWDIKTGKCVHTWTFPTAVKFVQFNEDGNQILVISEQRTDFSSTVHIFPVEIDVTARQVEDPILRFSSPGNRFTRAGWSYLNKWIIGSHLDGSISQYDAKTGELLNKVQAHDKEITDLQFSQDLTYFITSSKDKTAKIFDTKSLNVLKTFMADAPLNTAAITPTKNYVILGGGQDAKDVTTTGSRQGKFEARFYHKIFEDEIGRLKGHFGPLNSIVVQPDGKGFASGGEDGYVRLHHFDKPYFDFLYDVERMRPE
ncbi:WD40-repeat-containing domain protein [Lipomyces japonicus]|uniref:WD40-repeat-containing domain protein n=1 Tax=Lipomyces japonicus TaxID=56871 RepID=UPI0034CDA471